MEGRPTFRIGHLKIVDHLILGVTGHLLENDTDRLDLSSLDTTAYNSWTQISESMVEGSLNGAFITIPKALDLFSKGLDIRVLMFTHRGGSMIVKKRDSDIKQIQDFTGRSVLVPSRFSVQHMLLHRLLSSAGIHPGSPSDPSADLFIEPVSPYLMPQMIQQDPDNDIAGFAVAEPYASQARVQGTAKRVCLTGSLWANHPCCAFVLHHDMIRQYPDAVSQLIAVFKQAAYKIHAELNDCLLSVGSYFLGQPEKVLQRIICDTDICFDPALLIPDLQQIKIIQNYMADTMHLIKNKTDIEHFIDASFINSEDWDAGLEN